MKTIVHKSNTRGHAHHGWLNSYHTFSFAGYHNPERIHFGALRVLNDDVVKGGAGFGAHPHDNMEIISIPLRGALEHRDNTGGHGIIKSGEVQIMSAGTGIVHSEKNASATDDVNFLQVWVFPKQRDIQPHYDQKYFDLDQQKNSLVNVVSPERSNGALWINQDAWFSLASLDEKTELTYKLNKRDNGLYLFVIEGSVQVADEKLDKRDGLGIWDFAEVSVKAETKSRLLFMEVPMSF